MINPDKYIQHNLAVADGLSGFGALLAQLPKDSARVATARVFEDGDFVFAHTEYDFFGPEYTQHNPQIGDGLSGLGKALEALASQGITMKYDRIARVLGEGSLGFGRATRGLRAHQSR